MCIQDSVQALGTAKMCPRLSGDGLVCWGAAFTSAGQALGHGGCEGGQEAGKEEAIKKWEEQGQVDIRTEEGGERVWCQSGWLMSVGVPESSAHVCSADLRSVLQLPALRYGPSSGHPARGDAAHHTAVLGSA